MAHYKHYSFDLWLTLIKSNPLFKAERARIFHSDFNSAGKSLDEVTAVFRQVDLMCNAVNERTGKNIDADEMYLMVISLINDNKADLQGIDTDRLYADMEDLLFSHLPVLYSTETIAVLEQLREAGATMNILSNTGFIKGGTLRKVLTSLALDVFFDFQLYSDEEGMSKPNPALFNLLLTKVAAINKGKDIHLSTIMHVGDNPVTDAGGAKAAGISSLLVNSNNIPISTILDHANRLLTPSY